MCLQCANNSCLEFKVASMGLNVIRYFSRRLTFCCYRVVGWYVFFYNFPRFFWFSAFICFLPEICGKGCRIFWIFCFHTCFMFIKSTLEFTGKSYVCFLFSCVVFDRGLIDYSWLIAGPWYGAIFFVSTVTGGFRFSWVIFQIFKIFALCLAIFAPILGRAL